MPIQKVAHKLGRTGATELIHRGAVYKQDGGRKTAQLIAAGEAHVLVGLDAGQDKAPGVFAGEALQYRGQDPAGWTPIGPEIDQDWRSAGCRNDTLVEIVFVDVNGMCNASHNRGAQDRQRRAS